MKKVCSTTKPLSNQLVSHIDSWFSKVLSVDGFVKMRLYFSTVALAAIFFSLFSLGGNPNAFGQKKAENEQAISPQDAEGSVEGSVEDESVLGLDKATSERLLSSLRKGVFSKNIDVSYRSLEMFSSHPELHQGLGEGVQLELVKQAIKHDSTSSQGFDILVQSEIKGIEREDLLLAMFKSSFRENTGIVRKSVLNELSLVSDSLVDRFVLLIDKDPLGDHSDKLKVIEHFGSSAEKALPALLKRYRALKELAAQEGRAANYMDVLFAVGEIRSKDGMEIILDAINERGGEEQEQYALVGFECLKRFVDTQNVGSADDRDSLAKYLKYAQSLVKTYDKDSDGLLSQGEMTKMSRPPRMDCDRDRDNKLSEKEIAQSLNRGRTSRTRVQKSRSRRQDLIRDSVRFKQ